MGAMPTLETYPIGRPTVPATLDRAAIDAAIDRMAALPGHLRATLAAASDHDQAIRDGAWSIRQVVHHLADTHMNAFLRTKRMLTEDGPVVEPISVDGFAATPDAHADVEPSLTLLDGLHRRWVPLLRGLDDAGLERVWHVRNEPTPRSLWRAVVIYGWHGDHHAAQIEQALTARR